MQMTISKTFVAGTNLPATLANIFHTHGYKGNVDNDHLNTPYNLACRRFLYFPLVLLDDAYHNLQNLLARYPQRHECKRLANSALKDFKNYFSCIFEGHVAARDLEIFDDFDTLQQETFGSFRTTAFAIANHNYHSFPTPEQCDFYSHLLTLTAEVQMASLICKELHLANDPQHDSILATLERLLHAVSVRSITDTYELSILQQTITLQLRKYNDFIKS